MKKRKPKISVVMPAYNCEGYIGSAIESILKQTFKDFEFIILDDGSSDNTLSVVKNYAKKDRRIKVFRNKKNLQIARTLNKAVKLAKADIVARMDSDDISYKTRLSRQYHFLMEHPDIAIVGSNMSIMDDEGKIVSKREYPTESHRLKKISFRYSPFAHPSVVFRKKVFLEFGGYDHRMVPCEDIDLWFKIGSKYEFANIPKTLLKYRLVISSNSHKSLKKLELLGFKIKINAIRNYGYKISFGDIVFNAGQFASLWFMNAKQRIYFYDFLRSRGII